MNSVIGAGGGGKSGSSGGGISEAEDTLSSYAQARFVDLLCEGPIQGLVNNEYSIYLDGVPLKNLDGTPNYKPFTWASTYGTQDQAPLPGFTGTSQENAVGTQFQKVQGKIIKAIPDADADAVRVTVSVNGLTSTSDKGKIDGTSVDFNIFIRVQNGVWVLGQACNITGKTKSKYQRSYEVPLAQLGAGPYEVAVERVTADATSSLVNNGTFWDSYTVINYEKYSYPNSALVGIQIDSRYFSNIPSRSYHLKGLVIRVPANYNPASREYATTGPGTSGGGWDGTFKLAYSNNPAWCFYDLCLNPRYGLGQRITADKINKWEIYQIGKYCDELVPTGNSSNAFFTTDGGGYSNGGLLFSPVPTVSGPLEPRFTLNCVINTKDDAYKVLSNLSSVFRGMTYWSAGQVALTQDRPTTPSMIYTNANVKGGMFNYEGSSRSQRHTTALVGWNDPSENFIQKFEYIEDADGIKRYGIRSTEVVAFGCTSRSQARRLGLWLLYTERVENDAITFNVGPDSAFVRPGNVIKIADNDRAGVRWGGRLLSVSGTLIQLDAPVTLPASRYTLSVIMPDGTVATRDFVIYSRTTTSILTLQAPFDQAVLPMAVWTLASNEVKEITARVVGIKEASSVEYAITCLRHLETKYDAIELGVGITPENYTFLSINTIPVVTGLVAVENSYKTAVNVATYTNLEISWDRLNDPLIRGYAVTVRDLNSNILNMPEVKDGSTTMTDVTPGIYTVEVRAINQLGAIGPAATFTTVVSGVDTTPPPQVEDFTYSILPGGVELTWTKPNLPDYQDTEIHIENAWNPDAMPLFRGSSNTYLWPWPSVGNYTLLIKHRDTSGNMSLTSEALLVQVTSQIGIQWEQITGKPDIAEQEGDLLDTSWWAVGAPIQWGQNNDEPGDINDFVIDVAPKGNNDVVWRAKAGPKYVGNGENFAWSGGWNASEVMQLDATKAYRFAIPMKRVSGTDTLWWGPTGNVATLNTTNIIGNPYWFGNARLPVTGRWYLFVGYVYPYGKTGYTHDGSGVYDMATGSLLSGGVNYNFGYPNNPDGRLAFQTRAYQFYSSDGVAYIGRPLVHLVDGNEPSLVEFLAKAAVANADQLYSDVNGRPAMFRVNANGFADASRSFPPGIYNGETGVQFAEAPAGSFYNMVRISRATSTIVYAANFPIRTNPETIPAFVAALNGSGSDVIVVVYTTDEPQVNRLSGGLPEAMYRCGASRSVFGSPQFLSRSAYILVGIGGCGEGNGSEAYGGSVDSDSNAWAEITFQMKAKALLITGGSTPRSLRDYAYTGDYDAAAGDKLVVRGPMTLNGSTLKKTGGSNAWDEGDAYSVASFVAGSFVSFSYTVSGFMMGLNTDPTTNQSYTSIDACFYIFSNTRYDMYESGNLVGAGGTCAPGDVFTITHDGVTLRYYINERLVRTIGWLQSSPTYLDSAFAVPGATATNIQFGPMSSAQWGAIGGAGRPQDNATVGATLGTNVSGQITPGNSHNLVAPNAIDNVLIGKAIYSDNFNGGIDLNGNFTSYGSVGWGIGKGGLLVTQSAYIRGDVQASSLYAATGTFQGKLTAGFIGLNSDGTASRFEDNAAPGVYLPSQASGQCVIPQNDSAGYYNRNVPQTCYNEGGAYDCSYSVATANPYWDGSLRFHCCSNAMVFERRIRSGSIRFSVLANCTVDDYLSIWFRKNDGPWSCLAVSRSPASDFGLGVVQWQGFVNMAVGEWVDFGVTASDDQGRFVNNTRPQIKAGYVSVTATNF